ncbi:MAG: bifunctional 3-deoxy-7-phosphoheptulonate synthase/chorismate mutase type II [Bacteroidales bacterium]|nr:bifunctional 3-deoxy-7-phosphoheptulonate synthase/chorismate mutase type II [Bacteroidales bacterium]
MSDSYSIQPLNSWLGEHERPAVISGPCSAESREQVLAIARQLAKIQLVKALRAGIWKPRTRPSAFEGVGEKGLKWLQEVQAETGLKITVEVARPSHIEQALSHGIDILWIGARTTGNPFSIQELAEALQGVDVPVMVKNPLNPDLKLWLGALERFNQAGITKLAAVHRGFHCYDEGPYRNNPRWEIPIELKRLVPGLPILCDPSHICGNRHMIAEVSQKALDLEMDGLMIETHTDPDNAITDSSQQIVPEALKNILNNLTIRIEKGDQEFSDKLKNLRRHIDRIDKELIEVLGKRMNIVHEMGEYKRDHNITILQIERWRDIINSRLKTAEKLGLDRDFLLRLLQLVHNESIRMQNEILNRK